MSSFKDHEDRTWRVRIPVTLYNRWRDDGLDLLDPADAEKLSESGTKRAELLIKSLEKQGKDLGMTFEDIDDMLADHPEVYLEAHQAFEVAYSDFSQRMNRPTIGKILTKVTKAMKMAEDITMKRMDSPKMDQLIEKAAAKAELEADAIMTQAELELGSKNSAPSSDAEPKT